MTETDKIWESINTPSQNPFFSLNTYQALYLLAIVAFLLWIIRNAFFPRLFARNGNFDSFQENDFESTVIFTYNKVSAQEYVLGLEQHRKICGFKPGWLFYRCQELGLLDTFYELKDSGRIQSTQKGYSQSTNGQKIESAGPERKNSPYETLGISAGATLEEIKKAYTSLIKLYHPDLVDRLGPEIKELAKKKSSEIISAYETLRKKYSA